MDLGALELDAIQLEALVKATGEQNDNPAWTYSDIRTRLYPRALSMAFPAQALNYDHLIEAAQTLKASPVMEDR